MRCATRLTLAACFLTLLLPMSAFAVRSTTAAPAFVPAFTDCEGDACPSVTFTFDEEKQQYRARNGSPERWVRVAASNLAASSSVCLPPGKDEYLALKSIAGSYRADYSEPRCGAGGAE
jgi:hypothetical protein